jgi:hypothetical protein
MHRIRLLTLASLLLCGYGVTAQAALVDIALTPADCTAGYPCWTSNDTNNLTIAEIEAITGASDLESLYKENVGDGFDSGPFAGSYETTFSNSALDPEDALIELIAGMDPITCGVCILVIKDGNQMPAQYIFDLSLAGMIETISMTDFWPAGTGSDGKPLGGAISHVEILGGGMSAVPVPAAAWLFGTALIGFIGFSRRTKV